MLIVFSDDPVIQYGIPASSLPNESVNPALASTFTVASRWLEECKTAHAECRIRKSFLPTRLVDVGPPDGSETLKLVDTRQSKIGSETDLEYVTLSHCWGLTEHITTTEATIERRKVGIAFSELNRTFQDAVLVTRALGFRYIWIDSLCIVQDSARDWEKESSLMGSVYSSGAINIAADAAEDGDQGFLSKKRPSRFPYSLVDEKLHGTLYTKPSKRQRWMEYSGNLRRRAWVFQEYNLSARSIRYGLNGLIWECRSSCSFDSEVLSEENQFRREARSLKNFPLQVASVSPSTPPNRIADIMATWQKLVDEYTKKELTYETDMLPALSGLASLVQAATGDQYLAGLWRSDLPAALRWVPQDPDWRSPTSPAPTWSWAACKKSCPVVYIPSPNATKFEVRILDAGVVLSGDNPFGGVSDGFITLEGLLKRGICTRSAADLASLDVSFETNGNRVRHAIRRATRNCDGDTAALPPVWFLKLCVETAQSPWRDDTRPHGMLVLEEDVEGKVFRRLAYLSWLLTDADWAGAETKTIVLK